MAPAVARQAVAEDIHHHNQCCTHGLQEHRIHSQPTQAAGDVGGAHAPALRHGTAARHCRRQRFARRLLADLWDPSRATPLGALLVAQPPQPPQAWWDMEREVVAAAAAGVCPVSALRRHLAPSQIPAPPTPGINGDRCQLAACSAGNVFSSPDINRFLMHLFAALTAAWRQAPDELPQVWLSRYDLFHAHMVLVLDPGDGWGWEGRSGAPTPKPSAPVGIALLFHSQEYPAYDKAGFPYALGWCQGGSYLRRDPGAFPLRNAVWYSGSLAVLDTGEGSPAASLLWSETAPLHTVYETDLGIPLGDVNLLLQGASPDAQPKRCSSTRRDDSCGVHWWQGVLSMPAPVAVQDGDVTYFADCTAPAGAAPAWASLQGYEGGLPTEGVICDLREVSMLLACCGTGHDG